MTPVTTNETRAQKAHSDLYESVSNHPMAKTAAFFTDMIRGMNQALNCLELMEEWGYDRLPLAEIIRFCGEVERQRQNATLKYRVDGRDMAFILFNYELHPSTKFAVLLGRRVVLVMLRLKAEREQHSGKLNLAAYIGEIRDSAERMIYDLAWFVAKASRSDMRAAFDAGL